jgi:hypothetical protein
MRGLGARSFMHEIGIALSWHEPLLGGVMEMVERIGT